MNMNETSDRRATHLSGRGVLSLAGDGAESFLQGLLTNSVPGMAEGEARFAGLLSPQGKILFDFFLVRTGGGWLVDAPREQCADLVKRLTFYRLRAKVDIADRSLGLAVVAVWNGASPSPPDGPWTAAFRDPRLLALGWRIIAEPTHWPAAFEAAGLTIGDEAAWQAHRIGLAVPEGGCDYAYGDAFPHEACLDQLHGVDFTKGCYVGQEVISRMQHRGTARKRIVAVRAAAGVLPEPGTQIMAGGQSIGRLGSATGASGIAMIRLDRLARALEAGEAIGAGETAIGVLRPAWANFDVPGANANAAAAAADAARATPA